MAEVQLVAMELDVIYNNKYLYAVIILISKQSDAERIASSNVMYDHETFRNWNRKVLVYNFYISEFLLYKREISILFYDLYAISAWKTIHLIRKYQRLRR